MVAIQLTCIQVCQPYWRLFPPRLQQPQRPAPILQKAQQAELAVEKGPLLLVSRCCDAISTGYDNGLRRPRPTCPWGRILIPALAAKSYLTAVVLAVLISGAGWLHAARFAVVEIAVEWPAAVEATAAAAVYISTAKAVVAATIIRRRCAHSASQRRPPLPIWTISITTNTTITITMASVLGPPPGTSGPRTRWVGRSRSRASSRTASSPPCRPAAAVLRPAGR